MSEPQVSKLFPAHEVAVRLPSGRPNGSFSRGIVTLSVLVEFLTGVLDLAELSGVATIDQLARFAQVYFYAGSAGGPGPVSAAKLTVVVCDGAMLGACPIPSAAACGANALLLFIGTQTLGDALETNFIPDSGTIGGQAEVTIAIGKKGSTSEFVLYTSQGTDWENIGGFKISDIIPSAANADAGDVLTCDGSGGYTWAPISAPE